MSEKEASRSLQAEGYGDQRKAAGAEAKMGVHMARRKEGEGVENG